MRGENSFYQIGRRRLGKRLSLQERYVFVCRRLPTNKKLILCALCVSAVKCPILHPRESAVKYFLKNLSLRQTGRFAPCAMRYAVPRLRESAVNFLLKGILSALLLPVCGCSRSKLIFYRKE